MIFVPLTTPAAVSDVRERVLSEDDLERSEVGDDVGLVAAAGISKSLLKNFGNVLILSLIHI